MPAKKKKTRRVKIEKDEKVLKIIKKQSFKKKPVDYLSNIRIMFRKLQNLTHSLQNSVKEYSNNFKQYISSKSPFTLTNCIEKCIQSPKPVRSKFEVKSTKYFDLFVFHEKDLCTARSIFSELWERTTWENAKNTEKNGGRFPGLPEVIDHRKQLIYFLIILMRKEKDVVNSLVEILQLWYLIQPVVRELFKYTNGKITEDMEPILTDVDALYDCLLSVKKNCPTSMLRSVPAN